MNKVGIFYGPAGGYTQTVAEKIADLIGKDKCSIKAVKDSSVNDLSEFDNLLLGIATIGTETWNSEPVKSGWFTFLNDIEQSDLSDKSIAMFGLGDHIRYADHFVDAMGELYKVVSLKDVTVVGRVPAADYTFRQSNAVYDNMFVGLPIDEEFESSLTDQRIEDWVAQLMKEFK